MLLLLPRRRIRVSRLSVLAAAFCVALSPLLSFADGDAVETDRSANTPTLVQSVSATMHSATDRVVETTRNVTESALGLIGVRYKFGGETPEKGLDCSGLVKYVFEHVTGVTLPRRAREQAKVGEKVPIEALQPGDLVFFNTRRASFSHVGIYLGDNQFIHAPHRRSAVTVASIDGRYWKQRFNGARRVVGIMPGMVSIEAAKSILEALPVMVDPSLDK